MPQSTSSSISHPPGRRHCTIRRIAYPRWVLKMLALRQLFASSLAERQSGKTAPAAIREYERIAEQRGANAASASERTRDLARL